MSGSTLPDPQLRPFSGPRVIRADARPQAESLVSVVVPVYNEAEVIGTFYERAINALAGIPGCDYELMFVDDGSQDDSYRSLPPTRRRDPRVRVLKFSRNFGHQIAITAGIDYARGDCVVVIDADLQDPPEVIASMIDQWRAGFRCRVRRAFRARRRERAEADDRLGVLPVAAAA